MHIRKKCRNIGPQLIYTDENESFLTPSKGVPFSQPCQYHIISYHTAHACSRDTNVIAAPLCTPPIG